MRPPTNNDQIPTQSRVITEGQSSLTYTGLHHSFLIVFAVLRLLIFCFAFSTIAFDIFVISHKHDSYNWELPWMFFFIAIAVWNTIDFGFLYRQRRRGDAPWWEHPLRIGVDFLGAILTALWTYLHVRHLKAEEDDPRKHSKYDVHWEWESAWLSSFFVPVLSVQQLMLSVCGCINAASSRRAEKARKLRNQTIAV